VCGGERGGVGGGGSGGRGVKGGFIVMHSTVNIKLTQENNCTQNVQQARNIPSILYVPPRAMERTLLLTSQSVIFSAVIGLALHTLGGRLVGLIRQTYIPPESKWRLRTAPEGMMPVP